MNPKQQIAAQQTATYRKVLDRLKTFGGLDGEGVRIADDPTKNSQVRCPAHDDQQASMSLRMADDGRVLVNCKAGCSFKLIAAALVMQEKDFFPPPSIYRYTNRDGTLLYEVIRESGKKGFKQRRPDGKGGYIPNLDGVEKVLYNLPGIENEKEIFFTEGEKDADNLIKLGFPATTSGGATSWRDTYVDHLIDAQVTRVTIFPDNDDPGRAYAKAVARSCMDADLQVRIVTLPGLPPKGDVSDWLAIEGNTKTALLNLIAQTPWLETAPEAERQTIEIAPDSGLSNAQRFIFQHGINVRYIEMREQWLIWNGKYWKPDDTNRVMELAKQVVVAMFKDAVSSGDSKAIKWAKDSCGRGRLNEMLALASSDPLIAARVSDFDATPYIINVNNGLLDLTTGELRPHRQADMMSKMVPVDYVPGARSQLFERFLKRILPADDLRLYVQMIFGSALAGDPKDKRLPFVQGPPDTGKTTLINAVRNTMGDYAGTCDPETLLKKQFQGVRDDLASLIGLRLVTSTEPEDGRGWDAERIKALTGGETVKARRLYENLIEYNPTFLIVVGANNKPTVPASNEAFWRRLRLIPFIEQIPEKERDRDLARTLQRPEHQQAILAWLVEGCRLWQTGELKEPGAVTAATDEYQRENDPLSDWAAECLVFSPNATVSATDLRRSYEAWCTQSGEIQIPKSKPWGQALQRLGFTRDSKDKRVWIGGRLRTESN